MEKIPPAGSKKEKNSELTPNAVYKIALKLIAIGIILYVALSRIDKIGVAIGGLYNLLMPLLMGGLLALVLNTPMSALERLFTFIGGKLKLKKKNRQLAQVLALVFTFVLALALIYLIANTVIPRLIQSFSTAFSKIKDEIPGYLAVLEKYGIDTAPISEWVKGIDVNSVIEKVTEWGTSLIGTVASGASSIISGVVNTVVIIVFAVYLLSNKRSLSLQIRSLMYAYLKKPVADKIVEICSMTSATFSDFVSGQCLDAVLLGLLMFITMSIFRFPYAVAISFLITVTAVIPYVGAFLGGAFGVILIGLENPLRALFFLILFVVVQQVDNHLIYPRVVGKSVGLPAIWTFAAVIIGGNICGILGMLMFIPLVSVLYTLLRTNVLKKLKDKNIKIT